MSKKRRMGVEYASKLVLESIEKQNPEIKFYKKDTLTPPVAVLIKDKNVRPLQQDELVQLLFIIGKRVYSQEIGATCRADGQFNNIDVLLGSDAGMNQIGKTLSHYGSLRLKEKIKPFAFLSDPALTFHRIPFDPIAGAVMPEKWSRFLSNYSNVEAVCMWIGSLFFENSDRSQYLWLYGKGGNGKSTLAKIISSILGDFVRFEQAPSKDDKYWTAGLQYKRLVVLDDCNNYGFVKTGLFKSLTGSSKVRVEDKFCKAYDTDLDCKFLFTSNELPMVSEELADQRRIILSTAVNNKPFEFDKDFVKNLVDVAPEFISVCMEMYQDKCGDGRPIPTDKTEASKLAEIFNEDVEAWLERSFVFEPTGFVSVATFRDQLEQTRLDVRKVYKILENKGFVSKPHFIGGKTIRGFRGLKLITQYVNFGRN